MSLEDKIKAILGESVVPGTDAILGTKQAETLKSKPEELSGAEKTGKMTSKYNKGTKQGKLPEDTSGSQKDEKATSETEKITKEYSSSEMQKLKAESFEALFSGEQLTEEFKVKAEAIFEAAVEQVAEAKVHALQEEYQQQLDEAVDAVKGELVEQIDEYLDYVVEQWMQDNAIALESGIKVEMMESFMENLKGVFEAHYIDVPESKVDVLQEQADEIEALKESLIEAEEVAKQAEAKVQVMECEAVIAEHKTGLTAIEADKLVGLAENVEFESIEEFSQKVKVLKESFFKKTQDTIQEEKKETVEKKHNDVSAVLKALHAGSPIVRSTY